jgi:hypothetical protein
VKTLKSLNPIWVFAATVLVFVGWVAYDANQVPGPPDGTAPMLDDSVADDKPALVEAKLLGRIQPGMSQAEVRQHLRDMHLPLPDEVGPIDLSAGYPAYRLRYRVTLTHPLPQAKAPGAFKPGPHALTLLFDARRAGHPLVNVTTGPARTTRPM